MIKNDKTTGIIHNGLVERSCIHNLKVGDKVLLRVGDKFYKSEVTREAFWNSDSDEPCWEIETTNGSADEYSVWTERG